MFLETEKCRLPFPLVSKSETKEVVLQVVGQKTQQRQLLLIFNYKLSMAPIAPLRVAFGSISLRSTKHYPL